MSHEMLRIAAMAANNPKYHDGAVQITALVRDLEAQGKFPRSLGEQRESYEFEGFIYCPGSKSVIVNGQNRQLSFGDDYLMNLLVASNGRVLKWNQINPSRVAAFSQVKQLRRKLGADASKKVTGPDAIIQTVYGLGVRLPVKEKDSTSTNY